jgi:hypothetical protein
MLNSFSRLFEAAILVRQEIRYRIFDIPGFRIRFNVLSGSHNGVDNLFLLCDENVHLRKQRVQGLAIMTKK